MTDRALEDLLAVSKALSDASRVRILALLEARPLCVCQITEILALAPSTISKHLLILRHARLIETRKEGRWIHCRLSPGGTEDQVGWARKAIGAAALRSPRIAEDRRRLREVLRLEPEEVCRRQLKRRRAA